MGDDRPRVVLASGSPRRRDLLADLGVVVDEIRPPDIDESLQPGEAPQAYVERLAREKAIAATHNDRELLIAADTTVVIDADVLGKPLDDVDAARMLRRLGGRTHQVMTGFAVSYGGSTVSSVASTSVSFSELTESDISWYISTGEPWGKAGGYALQGRGACFVSSVQGSVTNVIGLPISDLAALLAGIGVGIADLRESRRE